MVLVGSEVKVSEARLTADIAVTAAMATSALGTRLRKRGEFAKQPDEFS